MTPAGGAADLEPRKPASTYSNRAPHSGWRCGRKSGSKPGSPEVNQEGRDRFWMADLFASPRRCCGSWRRRESARPCQRRGRRKRTADISVVDYALEPEQEAEAQQARWLAEMETELGMLPWMCPGRVWHELCCGEGVDRPGRNRAERAEGAEREARYGAGTAEARGHRILFVHPCRRRSHVLGFVIASGLLCIRVSALPLRMDMLPAPPQLVATPAESNDHLIPRD